MENRNPDLHSLSPETVSLDSEIVVVGSGPGGALTACLLAEAGRDVLLLEEGPYLPQSSSVQFSIDEMETKYRHGGLTFAVGRPNAAYVEGCCVGGGSEINSCLYHRPPEDILRAWSLHYQVDSLEYEGMTGIFSDNEKELGVLRHTKDPSAAGLKLSEGASLLGWRSIEAPVFFKNGGSSGEGARIESRRSMTETFLPRFLQAGGRLCAEARACRVGQRPRGRGWEVLVHGPHTHTVRLQAKYVFIAAGAVHTPALLRESGIGHNIGNSLRLHPTVKVVAEFSEKVNRADMGVAVHQVREFAPWYSFGCSVSSLPYLALALIHYPEQLGEISQKWEHMAIYYVMTSAGSGTVRQFPFFSSPLVSYDVGREGLSRLSVGLRNLCRLLFRAGAVALYPSVAGMPPVHSEVDIAAIPDPLPASRTSLMSVHLMGTCPMGEDRSRCAVDSYGRVHGRDGLFINDASILCDAVGVNPQGTIMALARRNVLHFLNS